jgi:hypothetical protein
MQLWQKNIVFSKLGLRYRSIQCSVLVILGFQLFIMLSICYSQVMIINTCIYSLMAWILVACILFHISCFVVDFLITLCIWNKMCSERQPFYAKEWIVWKESWYIWIQLNVFCGLHTTTWSHWCQRVVSCTESRTYYILTSCFVINSIVDPGFLRQNSCSGSWLKII